MKRNCDVLKAVHELIGGDFDLDIFLDEFRHPLLVGFVRLGPIDAFWIIGGRVPRKSFFCVLFEKVGWELNS